MIVIKCRSVYRSEYTLNTNTYIDQDDYIEI